MCERVPEKLVAYRKEIRELDQKVLELLAERRKLAEKIGRVKKTVGFPIEDSEQEKRVFEMNTRLGRELGLEESLVRKLTGDLIESAKKCQGLK